MRQRYGTGRVGDGEAGGCHVIHTLRHRYYAGFFDDGLFRVTSAMQIGHHSISHFELGDTVADLEDLAGAFQSRREGNFRFVLIGAGDHQDIGEIAPRGVNGDPDLTGTGFRFRDVFVQLQNVEFSQIVDAYRAHEILLGF